MLNAAPPPDDIIVGRTDSASPSEVNADPQYREQEGRSD
jgi:hypothetical protein